MNSSASEPDLSTRRVEHSKIQDNNKVISFGLTLAGEIFSGYPKRSKSHTYLKLREMNLIYFSINKSAFLIP